jgi:hypothetical protein
MRIETPEDQLAFDARIEAALGWEGTDTIFSGAAVRSGLASLLPQKLVGVWFRGGLPQLPESCAASFLRHVAAASKPRQNNADLRQSKAIMLSPKPWPGHDSYPLQTVTEQLPTWVATIRPLISRRSDLFAWVYGPSPATRELVHVRLPSPERRFLIGYLRASLRKHYPWLTTKHVAAMAFRPDAFNTLNTAPGGQAAWGPLYRRVVIQRGKKLRYLWVPNPVLKRLQKSLLRLLQPAIDRALSGHVFGARAGVAGPTFANAAQHLHRGTIVSLDIKDFFPSTTTSDVIQGLKWLASRSPLAVDTSLRPSDDSILPKWTISRALAWTDELRVFVARLGTHRGRLPQGSPLSPMLANVAFSPFDRRIIRRLNEAFGAGKVRYTRYFDDLTISLAPGGGGSQATRRTEFRSKCEEIIAQALAGSSYRLNIRKTRCGGTSSGHHVTGLVVRKNRVSLPRSQSRELRAIIRSMHGRNFVEIAGRWRALAGRPEYKFETVTRGHRAEPGRLRRYRLSAERLAVLMLRQLYPDLTMQCLLQHWYPWRERFESVEGTATGKTVWPLVEWVLSTLWTGRARARRLVDSEGLDVTNQILIEQDGQAVCRLEAESTLAFFFLRRDEAIAVVDCWHHFRGVLGYLSACPERQEFEKILVLRDALTRGMGEISIRAGEEDAKPAGANTDDARLPLTHESQFTETIGKWDDCFGEYVRLLGITSEPRLGQLRSRVQTGFSRGMEGFEKWIRNLQNLLALCDRLPDAGEIKGTAPAELLYNYIRVRADVAVGLVEPAYVCLGEFESRCRGGTGVAPPGCDRVQVQIAEALLSHFDKALRSRITNDEWVSCLRRNLWNGEVAQILEDQVVRLEVLHAAARSTTHDRRLFRTQSAFELAAVRHSLAQPIEASASDSVWSNLEDFSKDVYKVTCEAMEDGLCSREAPEGHTQPRTWKRGEVRKASVKLLDSEGRRKLDVLEDLRHRAAHGPSPERRKDWVDIQKMTASFLGRSWKLKDGSKKHSEYHAPDDLALTAYEGTMMKIILLRGVNGWLERIVETQWWRLNAGS